MLSQIRGYIKSWLSFSKRFSASSSDVDKVFAKIDKVLKQVATNADAYNYWDTKLNNLKTDKEKFPDTKDKIAMKQGKVNKDVWDKKNEEEKRKLWIIVETAFRQLRLFNRDRVLCGQTFFIIFLLLLIITGCIYQDLHSPWLGSWGPGWKLSPKRTMILNPKDTTEIWREVRMVELKLGEEKAKKGEGRVSVVKQELFNLKDLLEKLESRAALLSSETSSLLGAFSAELVAENPTYETYQRFLGKLGDDLKDLKVNENTPIWEQAQRIAIKVRDVQGNIDKDNLANLKADLKELVNHLDQLDSKEPLVFPFETSKLLGALSAEIIADDPTAHQTFQEFSKKLRADLESFSTPYFWTTSPWWWYEIFFWSLFGCLVGLLFYIASLLTEGIFNTEEIAMFWAEIFIAPLVVLVVFFLFAFTGITAFAPNEASITVCIGFAFVLGFAVRRTIGFLDALKKRIFPDPSSGSASPGM